jgi:sn-glycerol 3-phosphate transport system ATP-binding protein
MQNMTDISIKDARKFYGKTEVLRGVDLEVKDGTFVVILGPSGCGKSTLLRMIAGLEEISGGTISINGHVVNDLEPAERKCAMVFQNYALYPHMSVAQNIGYPLKVAGIQRKIIQERVAAVAETLGLMSLLDRKPAQLSGGQRQRVAMGRAMIREPSVFLFDEPLSNLDAALRVQMRLEIRRLHQRLKATSIFVTHDQIEAMTLADTLIVMRDGIIEQIGSPIEVYHAPASRFVAGFIGSPVMNFINCEVVSPTELRLNNSQMITLSYPRSSLKIGSRIVLGFRSEMARLVRTPTELPFDIDLVEELGSGIHIHGRLAGHDVVIAQAGQDRDASLHSAPMFLELPTDVLHFFDSVSGTRIRDQHLQMSMSELHVA